MQCSTIADKKDKIYWKFWHFIIGSQTPSFLNPIDYTDVTMAKTFYFIIHKILLSFKWMIMNINKPILHIQIISLQNQYIRC